MKPTDVKSTDCPQPIALGDTLAFWVVMTLLLGLLVDTGRGLFETYLAEHDARVRAEVRAGIEARQGGCIRGGFQR